MVDYSNVIPSAKPITIWGGIIVYLTRATRTITWSSLTGLQTENGYKMETHVHPEAGYKECIQRIQYYPSGLPWGEAMYPSEQPWKYNGKEFIEMHGLDEYDSKACKTNR